MTGPPRSFKRRPSPAKVVLQWVEYVFILAGILGVGYYGYVQSESHLFQAYQSWRFDQMQQGKPATVTLFLKDVLPNPWNETTPESETPEASSLPPSAAPNSSPEPASPPESSPPAIYPEGTVLGRIQIPRIHLSAMVLEGVANRTLELAVGHIPGTALPGNPGSIDLAAHRDTFFRGLRNVRKGDLITFNVLHGGVHRYGVVSTEIVPPSDTDILSASRGPGLNLITCYPFHYIGPAPKRYVVLAREMDSSTADESGTVIEDPIKTTSFREPEEKKSPPGRGRTQPCSQRHAACNKAQAKRTSRHAKKLLVNNAGAAQIIPETEKSTGSADSDSPAPTDAKLAAPIPARPLRIRQEHSAPPTLGSEAALRVPAGAQRARIRQKQSAPPPPPPGRIRRFGALVRRTLARQGALLRHKV